MIIPSTIPMIEQISPAFARPVLPCLLANTAQMIPPIPNSAPIHPVQHPSMMERIPSTRLTEQPVNNYQDYTANVQPQAAATAPVQQPENKETNVLAIVTGVSCTVSAAELTSVAVVSTVTLFSFSKFCPSIFSSFWPGKGLILICQGITLAVCVDLAGQDHDTFYQSPDTYTHNNEYADYHTA